MGTELNVTRHEHVFDPSKYDFPIHIVGAGATGSRVFAALVELGMDNINVYDPDHVEEHNLANQIYRYKDIGATKVSGCLRFAKQKLGQQREGIRGYADKVTRSYIRDGGNLNNGIIFLLTDTMKSREDIFNAVTSICDDRVSQGRETRYLTHAPLLIIETRMGSTHGTVFTINPFNHEQRKEWLSTLVDDDDEDNLELSPCGTTLSVGTTASLIANYAVWQMMQFFIDPVGLQPRVDLFFKPTLTITSQAIAA